ncbi:hypothetical protein ACJMK2_007176 [Sinanodonta woodiana]|uniref:SCP domain-containing protein n=1 Tax=Sinanodonta woodiana TaxID=1069815 RepID=A0ABD3VHP8_SINWO
MRSVGPSDQAGRDIISFAVRGFTPVASGSITLPINLDQSKSNTRRFQGQLQPNGSQAHDGGVTANSFPTGSLSFQNDIKHNMFVDSQLVTTVVNPGNTSHSDIPWLWQSLEISDKITGGSDSGSHKSTAKSAVDSGSDKKKTPRNNTWLNGPPQHPGFKQTDGITGFNTRQPDSFDGNNDSTTSSRNKPDSRNSLFSSKRTLPTGSPSSIFTTESRTIDISSGSLSGTFGMGTFSSSNSSSTVDSLGTRSITPSLSSTTTTSQQKTITCSEEYKAIRGHTLCMNDDPRVVLSGVTTANKISILNLHNDMRATIQPPAADLVALKWDERLAIIAAKWAKQCTFGHDNERRVLEIGTHIGQNVAVGHATWEEVVRTWYSEIRLWQYGIDPDTYLGTGRWMDVAHFTQIVQNTTYLVGCGYAECRNSPYIRFFVCNYAAGQSELAYPYTAGPRCGACARNCKNGLCDCGNNVCYNKGTLDPGTCTCKCRKPYAGSTCELLDCPVEDQWMCGQDWTAEYCSIYYNVPEECPHMCGLCKAGGVGGKIRQQIKPNTTFVSDYGCRYSGIRATPEECKRYGDNGSDMNMCAREGGTISCGDCDRFINVKRDYCPVMCGLCDAPCDGKRCANSGTLDVTSCTCTCRPPFAGSTCEQVDCPPTGDPLYCRLWPRHYCGVYYNVPEECPYMCDLCSMMTTRADP